MSSNHFTIGELAKRANVNSQTIRYYERRKLLQPSERSASGYRFYSVLELKQILFIKYAQDIGFTLKEIRELLILRKRGNESCSEVQKKSEEKLKDVRRKIQLLKRMESALVGLISDCSKRSVSACPFLERIEEI